MSGKRSKRLERERWAKEDAIPKGPARGEEIRQAMLGLMEYIANIPKKREKL